ncbi:hypothetical protein LVJ82_17410 [Vitreoscilla massiliensis]|uniref:Phage baseplate assembly protein V n=1 Tax=Vitreoscilla massiliensis TaxID=1689272 RepID=A0ABY4E084_9NEIS|nr:hypothetical protein [Vitreoscilla massiliensis]UOO89199.1 hypothetical protein LVJ82_17410 [Vitreoscilla massiliensis]
MAYIAAVVKSYTASSHRARIEIPGMTDGADTLPEAEIMYPVGHLHSDTEILIRVGDKVYIDWLIDGDSRTPVIVGYRNPKTGNLVDIRRIRQTNIELIADAHILLRAPKITLDHDEMTSTGINQMQAQTNLNGGASTESGAAPEVRGGLDVKQGDLNVPDGDMSNKGVNVGSTHYHNAQGATAPTSTAK